MAVRSAVARLVLQLPALHQVLKQLWLFGHKDRQLDFASNVSEISDSSDIKIIIRLSQTFTGQNFHGVSTFTKFDFQGSNSAFFFYLYLYGPMATPSSSLRWDAASSQHHQGTCLGGQAIRNLPGCSRGPNNAKLMRLLHVFTMPRPSRPRSSNGQVVSSLRHLCLDILCIKKQLGLSENRRK